MLILTFAVTGLCGQKSLTADLAALFGNLPMHLPVAQIVAAAEKDERFKGAPHYNLDLSYTGELTGAGFFLLKPDVQFVEIVANAAELFPDTALSGISYFSLNAAYHHADTLALRREFERVADLFSAHFPQRSITRQGDTIYFYNAKEDKRPCLSVYLGKEHECYNGRRCIQLVYFKLKG